MIFADVHTLRPVEEECSIYLINEVLQRLTELKSTTTVGNAFQNSKFI